MTVQGLVLCDDLIFFSRISGTARAAGLTVRQVKSSADAITLAKQQWPSGVIVDLQNPGLDLLGFLAELKVACPSMPRIVVFGSHVEADVLKAARQAGCDRVMPRSQFAKELEGSIAQWLGKEPNPPAPFPKKEGGAGFSPSPLGGGVGEGSSEADPA